MISLGKFCGFRVQKKIRSLRALKWDEFSLLMLSKVKILSIAYNRWILEKSLEWSRFSVLMIFFNFQSKLEDSLDFNVIVRVGMHRRLYKWIIFLANDILDILSFFGVLTWTKCSLTSTVCLADKWLACNRHLLCKSLYMIHWQTRTSKTQKSIKKVPELYIFPTYTYQ